MGKLSGGLDCLVIAPHPDDAEVAVSGTILRLVDAGHAVGILDLTAGEAGSRGDVQTRALETAAASRILGIAARENLGLPDASIENTPEARAAVAEVIRRHRPLMVLAPYPEDRHPDHTRTGLIAREAAFLAGLANLPSVGGSPHRPALLAHYMLSWEFPPTFVVDVTDVWDRKMEAIRAYPSQFKPSTEGNQTVLNHPEFASRIEARFRYFGSLIGARYGEPFWTRTPLAVKEAGLLFSVLRPVL